MTAGRTRKKSGMSDEQLEAMSTGRAEGAAIRRYLVALENHKPRRGRKRSVESMRKRLTVVEQSLKKADPLSRVLLLQERIDLIQALEASEEAIDLKALEDDFVSAAATYGDRKGISYAAWREAGVDPAVLRRAGIRRNG